MVPRLWLAIADHPGAWQPLAGDSGLWLDRVISALSPSGGIFLALNAARAQGFSKWVLSGTTLTLYAADGTTTVRTFTLDSANAPTQRS
jgi:hypothetical protein